MVKDSESDKQKSSEVRLIPIILTTQEAQSQPQANIWELTYLKIPTQKRAGGTDEWIKKMWYLYTTEFYAAMKNEMLSFAGKWMELENIILSEVSLAQKTKNRMFSLICGH
jgi:hypothetical protein